MGCPVTATAVTGTLTVTEQSAAGFIYLGPDPTNSPTSSTLNFPPGDNRATGVTVALSPSGSLSATYSAPGGGSTQLVFDVTGYFVPDASGATYVPLSPSRVLDTRVGNGLSGPFSSGIAAHGPDQRAGWGAPHRDRGDRHPDRHRAERGRLHLPGPRPDQQPRPARP